ncbi:MAG: hypothetical protein M3245_00790 [Actinomycetota bacterium]|nr:hypothetical protein [Actinomycetota bacterium]
MHTLLRRLTVLSTAGALVALTAGTAPAVLGDGNDRAQGGGQRSSFRFGFHAHVGELGSAPKGRFTFTVPEQIHATARVDCFRVDGNRAVLGGRIEEAWAADETLGPPEDEGFVVWVEDNGPPVDGQSRDRISPIVAFTNLPGASFPYVCPPTIPPVDVLFRELAAGDLTVHDG